MDEVLSPPEMRLAEMKTVAAGTSEWELMKRAGLAVADYVTMTYGEAHRITVLAGSGNNSGDGLVAAHALRARGHHVALHSIGSSVPTKPVSAATEQARRLFGNDTGKTEFSIATSDLVIDAIFGLGLNRPVAGHAAVLIDQLNASKIPVVSVDIPSGIDGASGKVYGNAVQATATVTFFRMKFGHMLYPGRTYSGSLHVAPIGIPDTVLKQLGPLAWRNSPLRWGRDFPYPGPETHKYQRGHTIVVSGGVERAGAARLAARAALRCGSGLVTIATPVSALASHAAQTRSLMLEPIQRVEQFRILLQDKRVTTIVIGPGLGQCRFARAMVQTALVSSCDCVLDADTLTILASDRMPFLATLRSRKAKTVLTPHRGEFSRLFGPETAKFESRIEQAREAAKITQSTIVYKGADTVIASPNGCVAINDNAPAWLATAGTGDVLAGIIGALLAQGMPAHATASAAVWMHGQAGKNLGPYLIAEDLESALQCVARQLAERSGEGEG